MPKLRIANVAPSLRLLGGQPAQYCEPADARALGPAGLRVGLESK
jgi:hypothetical protein